MSQCFKTSENNANAHLSHVPPWQAAQALSSEYVTVLHWQSSGDMEGLYACPAKIGPTVHASDITGVH
jgi:hypothetical protein